jgi:hypothetical protein
MLWLLWESTATDTSTSSSEVMRPIVLIAHRPPSAERVSQPFFTVVVSPAFAAAGTPQSWASSTVFIRVKACLREAASNGPCLSTSSDRSLTWSFTVVRVRPQELLTVVSFKPSRLLHLPIAVCLPSRLNRAVVALLSLSRIMGLARDSSVADSLRPASWAFSSAHASTCTLTMLAVSYFSEPR